MLRLCISLALLALGVVIATPGLAEQAPPSDSEVRGVNPADNLTKIEILPKLSVVDDTGGISVFSTTLKYDRAIQGNWGVNIEAPLVRFESPYGSHNGIGDVNLRGRYQFRAGKVTGILGLETVLPIASDDTLGSGKWQLNPTIVGVVPIARTAFVAAIAKQMISVAGSSGRQDISRGQYRSLVAFTSPHGWWALADPQYWVDYKNGNRNEFLFEGEFGRMVGHTTGIWVRAGGHVGGNWTQSKWSISGGIRILRF